MGVAAGLAVAVNVPVVLFLCPCFYPHMSKDLVLFSYAGFCLGRFLDNRNV